MIDLFIFFSDAKAGEFLLPSSAEAPTVTDAAAIGRSLNDRFSACLLMVSSPAYFFRSVGTMIKCDKQ